MSATSAVYKRQWLRCRTCGNVSYYDYLPYSFSNQLLWQSCGHGAAERDMGAENITEAEAFSTLAKAEGRS